MTTLADRINKGNPDPTFEALVTKANSKGLHLRRNAFKMGFCLVLPDKVSLPFKSFSALSDYINSY